MTQTSEKLAVGAARGRLDAAAAALRPDRAVRALTAGLLGGVLGVIWSISYATLIFSGPLSSHLGQGLALGLISVAILNLVAAFGSALPVAEPQDKFALIVSAMAAAIAGVLRGGSSAHLFPTVLALIIVTSLATGGFFLVLGVFRLGQLARYVPFPVIGGFLAGTGWLIAVGAGQVLTGIPLTLENLHRFAQGTALMQTVMGVAAAVILVVALQRFTHFLVLPALLILFTVAFYAGLAITSTSVAHAGSLGLLLGPFPGGSSYHAPTTDDLHLVDWGTLAGQVGGIISVMLISAVGLLLNVASLEASSGDDLDLNRELRTMGVGNLVAGAAGGFAGYNSLSSSLVAMRIGSRGKLVGLVAATVGAVILVAGTGLLGYIPRFLVGGLLLYLGITLLGQWVVRGWYSMSRLEYAIVLVILVVIARLGFLPGLLVGIALGIMLFVVTYSRIGAVKHELTGATYHSNVERSARQREILREQGDALQIFTLQGFLFFGTTSALLERVRQRVTNPGRHQIRFVVLDWRLVSGVDGSVSLTFGRFRQLAAKHEIVVVLTDLAPSTQQSLERTDTVKSDDPIFRVFPDLDRGVEWCENQLLGSAEAQACYTGPLVNQLGELLHSRDLAARVLTYLDRVEVPAGDCVMQQGTPPDAMYLIESGKLSVVMEHADGTSSRVRTVFGSTLVGEMGFYLRSPRTASVIATEPSVLYRVDRECLENMETQDPQAALAFSEMIVRVVSERVNGADATIEALLR